MNYRELGLKVGLEIHQQLDTKKLFCNCPSILVESDKKVAIRELHAVKSEVGEVDIAALEEEAKGRRYVYLAPKESSCLVELDEEPPHELNREALEIALTIALMLNAKIIDEVRFMRKIVIDGSNPTGFQRTALIAVDGEIHGIKIKTICLEEEAARKIKEENNKVIYNLDRMGIPLIEIATEPTIDDPEKAREVAEAIGLILRSTKRVKRGIGTIRQDLNVSIRGGARIEIKGVQELDLIPTIIKKEVERQLHMLRLIEELKNRVKKEELKFEPKDLTYLFKNTRSKLIKRALDSGMRVYGLKLKGMRGLLSLGGDYRLGKDLAVYVKVKTGLKGIIHSDELPGYGITEEEIKDIMRALNSGENDAFVLIIADEVSALKALNAVYERVLMLFDGIPAEVRRALPDGNTEYMRPLPGAARMYPETDVPPIRITDDLLNKLRENIPEKFEEKVKRFVSQYGIHEDQAKTIIRRNLDDIFEKAVALGIKPSIVVKTLLGTIEEVRRDIGDIKNLTEDVLMEVFEGLLRNKFSKEAIPEILKYIAERGYRPIDEICEELGLKLMSEDEVRAIIREIVNDLKEIILKRKMGAIGIVMGKVMDIVRGKADGKLVSKLVKEEIKKVLGES
ncbi:MAG: Glu-tRNA(Gln) amidotransferase subunit GatE [Euryarchaeota archaeon]|nr:Glu-tRNA(Gln) amidotransferase subunit GatE [Euryarchaeota archaeon]